MKKLLALVLAGVMAFSLVACGGGSEGGEGEAAGDEKLNVILVCSQLGDKSFNDSADAGLKELKDEGLINYKALEFGTDNSKVNITLEEVAPEYDVVICNNLGYGIGATWLRENADTYADTMFLVYDEPTDLVENKKNVQMIGYKANESDFLAGALAALVSETGVIGFVGGMESPVIHDFLVGYVEGAKYVNPDIKVNVAYIGSYTDAAKGKDLGKTAIDAGADVLHAVAGSAGNGYLEAAMENGKLGIGVDSDQYEIFKTEKPDLAKSIVTSSLKNVGLSLQVILREMVDGTYEWSQIRWFGIPEGCAGIAKNENYLKLVPADKQAELDAIEAKVANGEIVVSTAYGMDADTLKTYH
ncbi:MAG: BMP family ABC transporter substrate-binding protein [Oscillospiraceae bacterium]|nr:BMP family ABC transporter substrate-binding protein [Oscillospiraceae bacterium]